jgi:hypothetical protein
MQILRRTSCCLLLAWGAIFFPGMVSTAVAQTGVQDSGPCGTVSASDLKEAGETKTAGVSQAIVTKGLTPVAFGTIVYDSNQGVCWLADANLAGNPLIRAIMGVDKINPDGTMDYKTALKWVDALNNFNGGHGLLGHRDWQLPDNPLDDGTCSSKNNGGFGISCTHSALGNLYSVGLGLKYPESVFPNFNVGVFPFANLQPMLYWDSDKADHGESTFSFNTGFYGGNTTKYNYFHVLPMALGPLGDAPIGEGVLPYFSGPAEGFAVYDTKTHISWLLDANLAAAYKFGVTGSVKIHSKHTGGDVTVPLIDSDGGMLFAAIDGKDGWLAGLNDKHFGGTNSWMLPQLSDLQKLYDHINIQVGDVRLVAHGFVGPFVDLQPGFYWACQRDQKGNSQSPCDPTLPPPFTSKAGTPYQYSYNFSEGFEGTDLETKLFYVMVYYPAASPIADPTVP